MLTRREMQVAELLTRGLTAKAIAPRLGISVRTVQAHIANAADRIPGDQPPTRRLIVFFLQIREDS
jgi:FixJ family two-component response regulator